MTTHPRRLPTLAVLLCAALTTAHAQPRPGVAPDTDAMYVHLKRARAIAADDLYPAYTHRCILDQAYRTTISRGLQASNRIEPVKVFDNLYFVGENNVSAWALDTGDGIVLFDAMNSEDDIRNIVEPGLRQFGLDPRNIKHLIITHAHGDHFGGARYLRRTYGTRLLASRIDWDVMAGLARPRAADAPMAAVLQKWAALVPEHDIDIEDGQTLSFGKSRLTFYVTPGHTPGTVSTVFEVTDAGRKHVVGFFGGMGTPASADEKKALIASARRFEGVARNAGVDALIANHVTQDMSIPKFEELRLRRAGDPNPFVIGTERYVRFLQIQQECTLFAMAQQGQK